MKRIRPEIDLAAHVAVLRGIEPRVEALMASHLEKRRLWFPSELLEAGDVASRDLAERARALPDPLRVALALNLITEEGLPHFHRLLSTAFGSSSPWCRWNFIWTAEEDRHGCVLRDYAREARLFRLAELERLQLAYLENGFSPAWAGDPYKVLVYVTLQERATWLSHRNTGRLVAAIEPLLATILTRIAAEEARHYTFYREVFAAVLEADPSGALEAARFVLPAIEMPGVGMPGFRAMAETVRVAGVYGPRDYREIVIEVIAGWNIERLHGLDEEASRARDEILALPPRLERLVERVEARSPSAPESFPFLPSGSRHAA